MASEQKMPAVKAMPKGMSMDTSADDHGKRMPGMERQMRTSIRGEMAQPGKTSSADPSKSSKPKSK